VVTPTADTTHGTAEERLRIDNRYRDIADRFSSGNAAYAAEMMSERPVWVDTGDGLERIDPRQRWMEQTAEAFSAYPDAELTPLTLADLGAAGSEEPAVFFVPGDSLPWDTAGSIGGLGVYEWSPVPGASLIIGVAWTEQDHGVVELSFELPATGFGWVLPDDQNPWLTDRSLWPPIPDDPRRVTATVAIGSDEVQIVNGSDAQRDLVAWAIGRYTDAGLPPPTPRSVAFPPSATCVLVAGLAVDTGEGVDLQLCFGQAEACADPDCTPTLTARSTLIHELGHVWTVQHADETTRAEFLELRGLEDWNGPDLAWDERGTEHAAEILAWGLLDEPYLSARLPDDQCAELADAFEVLTGVPPLQPCPSG
jgi:hypothetical protein